MSKESIDPVLLEQVNALKLLTKTHNILMGTSHPVKEFQNVAECVPFIMNLHKQVLDEILIHPDAEFVEDIAPILKQVKEGVKNVASTVG